MLAKAASNYVDEHSKTGVRFSTGPLNVHNEGLVMTVRELVVSTEQMRSRQDRCALS